MPFTIVRNDIANMRSDAIVNTANPEPVIGYGTDSAIHAKAGPELLQARQRIGRILTGDAAITSAYELNAKYVIHTVGPVWEGGGCHEEAALRSCYEKCLRLACKKRCKSIAFPLISTGTYGFPKDKALQIAVDVFRHFLQEQEMDIYLVVFNREAYQLSESLTSRVASYIDENYVSTREKIAEGQRYLRTMCLKPMALSGEERCAPPPMAPCAAAVDLKEMLKQADAGFSETLLRLIDETGKKDAQIYKRANVSKQHFSKIRNNRDYKPTKATALAFAIALELDLEKTRDLIGRAGYALSNSSKFDLIIRFFIEQRNYDIFEINATLYEFDQMLLGV